MRRSVTLVLTIALTVLALLPPTVGAHASGAARAKADATLNALPATSEVGKRVTLKGRVGDSATTVKVQRRYGEGRWETVAKVATDRKGKFKTKVKLAQPGPTDFRVTKGKAKSAVRTMSVFGWLDLTKQPHFAADDAGFVNTPMSIGGRAFPTAFHSYSDSFRSFDITACTKVEGWTGFVDGSGATGGDVQELQWNSGVYGESIPEPPVITTTVGPAQLRTISVAGDNILYMALDVTQAGGDPQTVMGSPRAYCNVATLRTAPIPFTRTAGRWSVR